MNYFIFSTFLKRTHGNNIPTIFTFEDRQLKNEHYRKMKKDALAGLARKKRKGKISPGLETSKYF